MVILVWLDHLRVIAVLIHWNHSTEIMHKRFFRKGESVEALLAKIPLWMPSKYMQYFLQFRTALRFCSFLRHVTPLH